ncbi:hypothetical protein DSECCO2_38740 [anaerobic digester metagenome]
MLDIRNPVLPQEPGNIGAAADAKNITKGHQQKKDRHGQGNGGHLVGITGLTDKIGIGHVVDNRHQHT